MDSLRDKGLYHMLILSFFFFLLVGFLYPASPAEDRAKEFTAKTSLKKVDFTSTDFPNHISQGYGRTQFAAVFGGLRDGRHNGIDIAAAYGAEILSESRGKVVYIGDQDKYCYRRGYGKFVMVQNENDSHTLLYAHLSKIKIAVGDKLKKGDVLGLIGTTGLATGPHLHFSVFKTEDLKIKDDETCGPKPDGDIVNPIKYLAK